MAGKRIYSCILLFAIIAQCQAARNLLQWPSPSPSPSPQPQEQRMHFVLVHGAGHGAWCWFKVQPLLEAAGHNVTSIDLAASGINLTRLDELRTFVDYTQPLLDLMESIPVNEKVILVGHSEGGLNLPFAMDRYPEKIHLAIFLTAFMPDTVHSPNYIPEQYFARYGTESLLDSQMAPFGNPEDNLTSITFGPIFTATRLYPLSRPQDLTLARSLLRPFSIFQPDLARRGPFSNETYGSIKRAFILITKDQAIPIEFQRWLIENFPVAIVREIENADHMAMISQPEELFRTLLDIANSSIQEHFGRQNIMQI